jgi:hypothetical protein
MFWQGGAVSPAAVTAFTAVVFGEQFIMQLQKLPVQFVVIRVIFKERPESQVFFFQFFRGCVHL